MKDIAGVLPSCLSFCSGVVLYFGRFGLHLHLPMICNSVDILRTPMAWSWYLNRNTPMAQHGIGKLTKLA